MQDRYTFNERRKRLEPKNNLCQYCFRKKTESMESNYFIPVFKEQDRTNIIVYRSVKFNKVLIGIPRCKEYRTIHQNCLTYGWLISIPLIVGVIFSVFLLFGFGVFQLVFSIFTFAIVIVMGPSFFGDMFVRRNDVLSKKDGAMTEPLVRSMVNGGWSLTQPSA